MICPADGKEVHPEHVVKGYEIARGRYVVVQQSEIKACAPESSRTIDITDFVDLADIDPVYYDRPYYLLPDERAGKPYRLLLEAMNRSKKVAIAKLVMRDKEYLAALRPVGEVICLETMHFGDEVLPTDTLDTAPPNTKIADRELKIAQQLIDSLAADFDPNKYRDEYKDCIMELVEKKARGEEVVTQPAIERKSGKAMDLMAALEASLAQTRSDGRASNGRKRKSA